MLLVLDGLYSGHGTWICAEVAVLVHFLSEKTGAGIEEEGTVC